MCQMVRYLIWGTSSFYKSKIKKGRRGGKSAIWPNWCCRHFIQTVYLHLHSPWLNKNFSLTVTDLQMGCQKVPIFDFNVKNHLNLSGLFYLKSLGACFLILSCFLYSSIFKTLCFLKWYPIFDNMFESQWQDWQALKDK